MKFTKMQGCGNDYVYVNGMEEKIPPEKKPELVRRLSDRHFGIGGDGVIFINASTHADFEMEMCGNGIRCVAKYVYDNHLTDKTNLSIESFGKIKYIDLTLREDGKVSMVKVNMGAPILKAAEVPVISDNEQVVDETEYLSQQSETLATSLNKGVKDFDTATLEDSESYILAYK